MTAIDVVIMAAGKGTRMKSRLPKVLHRLAGRALLQHVLDTVAALDARRVVVITGNGAAEVEAGRGALGPGRRPAAAALRAAGAATGHRPCRAAGRAVAARRRHHADPQRRCAADRSGHPARAVGQQRRRAARAAGRGTARSRPATAASCARATRCAPSSSTRTRPRRSAACARSTPASWPCPMPCSSAGCRGFPTRTRKASTTSPTSSSWRSRTAAGVVAVTAADPLQVEGVNSPLQLAQLERAFQLRQARSLMEAGVRLADPARFDLRGRLECGQDVEIDVNCVFEGRVSLGDGVTIGANCVIANASIAAGAVIHPFTYIDGEKAGVKVGEQALVGPVRAAAARGRPGARSARGQLRGDQELVAGARRQGQPPGLPGRFGGGRARQLRRRLDHRQLRRRQQAPHGDRGRRARGQQLRAGGAGHHRPRRHRGRRLDDHQGHRRRARCRSRAASRSASPTGSGRRRSRK